MIHSQANKFVSVTPPAAIVDNGDYTTAEIDTLGFDYCTIYCYLGATDIAMTKLEVHEGDTSGSHTQVSSLVYGSSNDIAGSTSALPTADDDNKCFIFDIDLRNRKRYLDVDATAGNGSAGTFATIFAILSRADEGPVTAADRGAGNIVRA